MTKLEKRIYKEWDKIEELDPDISTESLFARVQDRINSSCSWLKRPIDAGDISGALFKQHVKNGGSYTTSSGKG